MQDPDQHRNTQLKTRRQFLCRTAALSAATLFAPSALAATSQPREKFLSFHNLHTEEKLAVSFWENGLYNREGLDAVNHLMRDHRNNQVTAMDINLLESLFDLSQRLGSHEIEIISGYRSPHTNEALRKQGRQVAKNSFHLHGRALDINFKGRELRHCLQAALKHHRGGVGYYPHNGFIHLDTGRRRRWGPI